MIIHFDFSAAQLATVPKALLEGCIYEAVRAHRLGYHLFIINREAADYVRHNVTLNAAERTMIEKLRSEYTQTADLVRRAGKYVRIAPLPTGTMRTAGRAVELSIDQAIRPTLYEKTIVVAEDEITDGAFYSFLMNNLRDVIGAPPLQCEWMHGGGDRTANIAELRIREKRIVCVLLDTDALSPACPEPQKVSFLRRLAVNESWPLIFINPTPCKETENLIPIDIVEMLDCAQERADELTVLRNIDARERAAAVNMNDSYWLYFDVKNGVASDKVATQHLDAQVWTVAKLALGIADLSNFQISGFGNHVVPQVMRENVVCARLRQLIRQREWFHLFGDFVADLMWPCVGGVRQFT